MELSELKNKIIESFSGNDNDLMEILSIVEADSSVFPFNEYEHLICGLIEKGGLTYQQYLDIRSEYISENPNLWIFEISAPRTFGEKFAQTYVQGKGRNLKCASKKLDNNYSGQYDLCLNFIDDKNICHNITIEVKASRVVESDNDQPLYVKALARNTSKKFMMNFQQLKPQCCDIFIWVAVFRDEILLWVMKSSEVSSNSFYSKGQHRGNSGNEGQLHVSDENIHTLSKYELTDNDLEGAIIRAFMR